MIIPRIMFFSQKSFLATIRVDEDAEASRLESSGLVSELYNFEINSILLAEIPSSINICCTLSAEHSIRRKDYTASGIFYFF
jgi:hypothetical protein